MPSSSSASARLISTRRESSVFCVKGLAGGRPSPGAAAAASVAVAAASSWPAGGGESVAGRGIVVAAGALITQLSSDDVTAAATLLGDPSGETGGFPEDPGAGGVDAAMSIPTTVYRYEIRGPPDTGVPQK